MRVAMLRNLGDLIRGAPLDIRDDADQLFLIEAGPEGYQGLRIVLEDVGISHRERLLHNGSHRDLDETLPLLSAGNASEAHPFGESSGDESRRRSQLDPQEGKILEKLRPGQRTADPILEEAFTKDGQVSIELLARPRAVLARVATRLELGLGPPDRRDKAFGVDRLEDIVEYVQLDGFSEN